MRRPTAAALAAWVTLLLAAPAAAENPPPCDWKFEFYGVGEGTVSCTCGPPGDVGLAEALGELTEELGVERPKYQGTIMQAVGSAQGTWTYAPGSNVCMAAIHAGLIPSLDEGGIVRFGASPGCPLYEGSAQNDIATYDRDAAGNSYYFPALTRGTCPGEKGYASLYDGPPASEVVPQMIELALPRGGARLGKVESLGYEAVAIDGLTLVPEPGRSQPIRIGRLVVERVDLQHLLTRQPPRYLTLRAEDISLPTKDLPPFLALLFGGQRVKAAFSLDWVYNPAKRELSLRGAVLSVEGYGTLRLRARLDAIPAYGGLFLEPETVQPRWIRFWAEDEAWLGSLLAVLLGLADRGDVASVALPILQAETPAQPGPRQRALLAALAQWIAAGGGEAQAFLQPVEPTSFAALAEQLAADPFAFVAATRLALVHGPAATDAAATDGPTLAPSRPFSDAAEQVSLAFAGAGSDPEAWIGVHYVGDPPDSTVHGYHRLQGAAAGRIDLRAMTAGLYEAVLWQRDAAGVSQPAAFAWFAVR